MEYYSTKVTSTFTLTIRERRTMMDVANALDGTAKAMGYNKIKTRQKEAVVSLVAGKDVFAVLPTGYGKSVCYCAYVLAISVRCSVEDNWLYCNCCHSTGSNYQRPGKIITITHDQLTIHSSINYDTAIFLRLHGIALYARYAIRARRHLINCRLINRIYIPFAQVV